MSQYKGNDKENEIEEVGEVTNEDNVDSLENDDSSKEEHSHHHHHHHHHHSSSKHHSSSSSSGSSGSSSSSSKHHSSSSSSGSSSSSSSSSKHHSSSSSSGSSGSSSKHHSSSSSSGSSGLSSKHHSSSGSSGSSSSSSKHRSSSGSSGSSASSSSSSKHHSSSSSSGSSSSSSKHHSSSSSSGSSGSSSKHHSSSGSSGSSSSSSKHHSSSGSSGSSSSSSKHHSSSGSSGSSSSSSKHRSSSGSSGSSSSSSKHHSSSGSSGSSSSSSKHHSSSSSSGSSGSSSKHHHHHHHHHDDEPEYTFGVSDENETIEAKYSRMSKKTMQAIDEERDENKKRKHQFKVAMITSSAIISILLVCAIVLTIFIVTGKNRLIDVNTDENMSFPDSVTVEDDFITYNGHRYRFNKNVTTILFSGVDRSKEQHIKGKIGTGGQADAIFVIALDTETGVYKIMALSRDAMVDVNVLDDKGNFLRTENMQICLSHAYGDGYEVSNENLKTAVSRMFFGLNINSYLTMDLDGIPVLNDFLGGVTVTVKEDLTKYDPKLSLNKTVTLLGNQAETYVRSRDIMGDGNQNNLRMARQQDYLNSFIHKAMSKTKENIMTPVNMYNEIDEYSRTDFDTAKIVYLASRFMSTGFSADENFEKVPGTTVMGEEYAEYHVDKEALLKMVIDTYYVCID